MANETAAFQQFNAELANLARNDTSLAPYAQIIAAELRKGPQANRQTFLESVGRALTVGTFSQNFDDILNAAAMHFDLYMAPISEEPQKQEEQAGVRTGDFIGEGFGRGQNDLEKAMLANTNNAFESEIEKEQEARVMATLETNIEGKNLFNDDGTINEEGLRLATSLDSEGLLEHQRMIAEDTLTELAKETKETTKQAEIKEQVEKLNAQREKAEKERIENDKDGKEKTMLEKQRQENYTKIQEMFKTHYAALSAEIDPRTHKRKYTNQQAYKEAYRRALVYAQKLIVQSRKRQVLGNTNELTILPDLTKWLGSQERKTREQTKRESDAKLRKLRKKNVTEEIPEEKEDSEAVGGRVRIKTRETTQTTQAPTEVGGTVTGESKSGPNRGLAKKLLKRLLGGAGAEGAAGGTAAGGGLLAALPEIAIIIVIILAFLFIIIIIAVIIIVVATTAPPETITRLTCGDINNGQIADIVSANSPQLLSKTIYDRLRVRILAQGESSAPGDQQVVTSDEKIYNAICLFWGRFTHDQYNPTDPKRNTFGNLTVGTEDQIRLASGTPPYQVSYYVWFDSGLPSCKLTFDKIQDHTIRWTFDNPDKCQDSQLIFLMGQSLAKSLITQETTTGSKVFESFNQIFQSDKRIPTTDCQNASSIQDAEKACFGDAVGEYAVYDNYLDAPSNTGFKDYPITFASYYNFIREKLFDGRELVTISSSTSGSTDIVNNAKYIEDNNCRTFLGTNTNNPSLSPCDAEDWNLYDNVDPGKKYPQPPKIISLTSITVGGTTYNIGNRFFSDGHRVRPWGRYWCTDLVLDSYTLAKDTAIVGWADPTWVNPTWDTGNASVMIRFFQQNNNKGYYFYPREQFDPSKILPGSVVFFLWSSEAGNPGTLASHVAIVDSVTPDQKHPRNGIISIWQANGPTRPGTVQYSDGVVESDVVGFGVKLAQTK